MEAEQILGVIFLIFMILVFVGIFIFYIYNVVTFFRQLSFKKHNSPDFKPGKYRQSQVIFIIFTVLYVINITVGAGIVLLIYEFFESM